MFWLFVNLPEDSLFADLHVVMLDAAIKDRPIKQLINVDLRRVNHEVSTFDAEDAILDVDVNAHVTCLMFELWLC